MNFNLLSTPIILLILLNILSICFFPAQMFSNCKYQKIKFVNTTNVLVIN